LLGVDKVLEEIDDVEEGLGVTKAETNPPAFKAHSAATNKNLVPYMVYLIGNLLVVNLYYNLDWLLDWIRLIPLLMLTNKIMREKSERQMNECLNWSD